MSKALLRTPSGEQLALVEARTPWTTTPEGGTETSAECFVELAVDLLRRGYQRAAAGAPLRVSAVAVAGLAESGVLLDGSGRPRTPVVAWFDRRGTQQIDSISLRNNSFGPEFVRRTGLPWDCQSSVAKLLWFVDGGLQLAPAHRWLSVPEYVVYRLGGELVHEPSLASRTGLLDQATGTPWADGAAELGLPPTLLPARQPYGESVGTAAAQPDCLTGCRAPRSSSAATTIRWRPSVSARPDPTNCSTRPERPTSSCGHCPRYSPTSSGNALSAAVSRSACTCYPAQAHSSAGSAAACYCAGCSGCSA